MKGKGIVLILIGIALVALIVLGVLLLKTETSYNTQNSDSNNNLAEAEKVEVENKVEQVKNEVEKEDTNTKENNIAKEKNIVLFNGLDITNTDLELSIPYTKENEEKYEITYYNYENGKFVGESEGKLETLYEGYAVVENTKKIAMSQKYDAIPRKYKVVEDLPKMLMELSDYNKTEIHSIDLDGDGKPEYIVSVAAFASPEDYDVKEYSNYSEILVLDSNFQKVATLVKAENQFWKLDDKVTDEFFCSLDDVEYIDIDNDGNMEIMVDTHVYEGIGVNVYKYKNGEITGNTNYKVCALP